MDLTVGQLVLFAGDYEPDNFYRCDGRLVSVTEKNSELANLLGPTFGGDGANWVGLPSLPQMLSAKGGWLQWLIAADGVSYSQGIASALGEVRPLVKPPPADSALALDWLPCDGRLIPPATNQALFSLIGTQYGGDGQTSFGLPKIMPLMTIGGRQALNYHICTRGVFPNPECDAINGSPNSNGYDWLLGSVSQFAINQSVANQLCGYILCQGQRLAQDNWSALFSILGTRFTYGYPSGKFEVPLIQTGADGVIYALVSNGVYPARS